jgi:starch-binding outer membrane protein, SusD/RagB family
MLRTPIGARRRAPDAPTRRLAIAAAMLAAAVLATACYNYDITDPNGPTLGGLVNNPSRANLSAAVTGMFAASRVESEAFVWRVGSMGREGVNLSNNNQPDYQEPYFGPLSTTQFGGSLWSPYYVTIRDANIIIDGAPKAPDLSTAEKSLEIGVAQATKALMFMYIIETRAALGAPIDVDRAPDAPPAPFVTEDSVYATILHELDSARTNMAAGAAASFPFPVPPGFANAGTPQSFDTYTWMLTAKALCLRATAQANVPGTPSPAPFYAAALHPALDSAGVSTAAGDFLTGIYFDYSNAANDLTNGLSDPLNSPLYFALAQADSEAQTQPGGAIDQRALTKIVPIPASVPPQVVSGIPIQGTLKFTVFFVNGLANTAAPFPVIRDEELVLLRAEAEIGTGALAAAVTDLNAVRVGSGNLAPYSGAVTAPALTTELIYNRRYSLLWEQGARWIDARRFGVLGTIDPGWANVPGFHDPAVPTRMPIPQTECNARNLGNVCNPLGT